MVEIVTYLLSDEKSPFILNGDLSNNWKASWKNRIYWYISFFHPSLNRVLFPMFYLLVEGECQILVF